MKKTVKEFKNWAIKRAFQLSERFHLVKKSPRGGIPAKFLVVSATGIGDTLWGTPAIQALKDTYPQSYLGVLVSPLGFETLKNNPNIDEFFIFRRGFKGVWSLPFLFGKLRKRKIATVFIFHSSDRVLWPLGYFVGPSDIIGIEGENKGLDFLLTKAIPNSPHLHGIEKRLNLVQEVGAQTLQRQISISLANSERGMADRFLKEHGIAPIGPIIGLHPGAQKPFKCWPARNFIEVGNILRTEFGCRSIITGDEKEKEVAEEVAHQIKDSVSAAGKLSLRETAALIEKLHLFITNDTGLMHIASALKIPTIALFSPTDPRICGPYFDSNSLVIEKPRTCSPCLAKNCHQPVCLEQITAEEVVTAAERFLGSERNDENPS
ncbi:MAG: glycosyltransferase family 9 protein [Proteobacteria bacterium]|nr:glycosyltransferase family 9 protein [Pseudomonadota bacterium]